MCTGIDTFFKSFTIFRKCTVVCCVDVKSKRSKKKGTVIELSDSNIPKLEVDSKYRGVDRKCEHNNSGIDNIGDIIVSESELGSDDTEAQPASNSQLTFRDNYILQMYNISAPFFDMHEIGKFITDIDGMCIYISKMGCYHIGKLYRDVIYKTYWADNIYSGDIVNVVEQWQIGLDEATPFIYKERRMIKGKVAYLLIEVHPTYARNKVKNMQGIIMRVPKKIWNKFDVDEASKLFSSR